jgi:uncharacterized coiled-coil protein SlyX
MSSPQDVITALRRTLVDKEREAANLQDRVNELKAQLNQQPPRTPAPAARAVDSRIITVDDALILQEVGLYEYHHPLENAEAYKAGLAALRSQIRNAITSGEAIEVSKQFSFNNSLAQGRRLTGDLAKLMLRAYNAEAENCVRTIRAGNLVTATRRLDKAAADIEKHGATMQMRIAATYHGLRTQELELTADYLMKVQDEREAAREERERLKDERKAEQELANQRRLLDKEREHYRNLLGRVTTAAERDEAQQELERLDQAIADNDYRAANIRAGYVYVISNIGAFGPNVVKIGLTRRLEPLDRIRELSSASVPFPFDVHAIYFSDDAVTLENQLHQQFTQLRLNHANPRREFFFATPAQVRDVLTTKLGNLLEYTTEPEATQYFQSRRYWPQK